MKIICVHGYLAPKAIFWPLATRLRRCGFEPILFGYPSHRGTLKEHGDALAKVIKSSRPGPFCIVAHSLGGLVTKQALTDHSLNVERLIFVATPHAGNAVSRMARRTPFARLLSDAVKRTATSQFPNFKHPSIGVITGTRDRVVTNDEGHFPQATDHVQLPFGHNDILLRPQTARTIVRFIRSGAFGADESLSFLRHHSEMS